jgi:hypothetical protein
MRTRQRALEPIRIRERSGRKRSFWGHAHRVLSDRFAFSDPVVVNLEGKGPTRARFLLGHR